MNRNAPFLGIFRILEIQLVRSKKEGLKERKDRSKLRTFWQVSILLDRFYEQVLIISIWYADDIRIPFLKLPLSIDQLS